MGRTPEFRLLLFYLLNAGRIYRQAGRKLSPSKRTLLSLSLSLFKKEAGGKREREKANIL